ncbi:DUF302 domain-containing protein [Sagittula salina]|uniref:DUF302 domain-containing protein n=1 Tax=Sagittula salina TaxID=2820268 RepID=A0A940MGA9_9RHOB|nr:DUF302 domain-containing protein [Sagittula salina]MBP0481165.1 DUF302 domain-containing protein [Sagittula salina]
MRVFLTAVLMLTWGPVMATADQNLNWVEADGTVAEAADRLEGVLEEAGVAVFARIDHAVGAKEAGMALTDAELVIFGNPTLGTPVMQENFRAGLMLPLRVLVVEDDGQTWFVMQDVGRMMEAVNVSPELDSLVPLKDALATLTEKAAAALPE